MGPERGEKSTSHNQYDHCQKDDHWRKACPKLKRKNNRQDKIPHQEMLDGRNWQIAGHM